MSQVVIYNNDPDPQDILGDKSNVQWGWRYADGEDTGTVFAFRDAAFVDAFAKYPELPIG